VVSVCPICLLRTAYNWNPTSWRRPADSPVVCGTPGAVPLLRCGTSSPGLKFTAESNLVRSVIIPDTRRLRGYTRFIGKYVTSRTKRFRPHKVYIFLIRIDQSI